MAPTDGTTSPLSRVARILRLDSNRLSKEVGSIAPFLVPFLKMTCVYFILDFTELESNFTHAFVKVLPILSLAWLVCLQGVGIPMGNTHNDYITYNRCILLGLLLSAIGDVTLVWQEDEIFFLIGMLFFACGLSCYVFSFGFSPFGLKEFVPCLLGVLGVLIAIQPCIPAGLLTIMIPAYSFLLAIMGWRSLARFNLNGDIPWRKIFSAFGTFLFVVSDVILAVNKFCTPVPFERTVTMFTYYGAQLCLALSVTNSHLHREVKKPAAKSTDDRKVPVGPDGMPLRKTGSLAKYPDAVAGEKDPPVVKLRTSASTAAVPGPPKKAHKGSTETVRASVQPKPTPSVDGVKRHRT